ncbi:MAG: toxin-antitoxin system HicB family antitoxin [Rhodomicrobium sp.]
MTAKTGTFALRLPLSLKAAIEQAAEEDGTSMNQFLVVAAAEKLSAMQTEAFFAERRSRANRDEFLRILNREGGEPPREGDELPEDLAG